MNKVVYISVSNFKKKFNIKMQDPYEFGLIEESDLKKVREDFGILGLGEKSRDIMRLLPMYFKDPLHIVKNFLTIVRAQIKRTQTFYLTKKNKIADVYPFSDYALKGNILASFRPKTFLEIGTSRGFGTTVFMSLMKNCTCFTLNPKNNRKANNPIVNAEIGEVFKNKGLNIKLLYKDSQTFNYNSLPSIDVCYIDGNHEYSYVYNDLKNCAKIAKKMVMLDDYIPSETSPRGDVFTWGWWNSDVVRAVNTFLAKYPKSFKEAYWIKNTPICVLIK